MSKAWISGLSSARSQCRVDRPRRRRVASRRWIFDRSARRRLRRTPRSRRACLRSRRRRRARRAWLRCSSCRCRRHPPRSQLAVDPRRPSTASASASSPGSDTASAGRTGRTADLDRLQPEQRNGHDLGEEAEDEPVLRPSDERRPTARPSQRRRTSKIYIGRFTRRLGCLDGAAGRNVRLLLRLPLRM